MNGNLLLHYLSELSHGYWGQFSNAIDALGADWGRSTHARQLSMLGHIEFDFLHRPKIRWAICPNTLAWLPRSGSLYRAVLCGWRTEPLLGKLKTAAQELECTLVWQSQQNNPDAIFISAAEEYQLDELAMAVGLDNQPQSAERLAQCLPPLDDYLAHCKAGYEPAGYGIRQFDAERLNWYEVEESAETGFFEYLMADGSRTYCIKSAGHCTHLPRDIGLYVFLQRPVLHYDKRTCELHVPFGANLPDLFARAATLCSGRIPTLDSGIYRYQNVSPSVAYNIASKLNHKELI